MINPLTALAGITSYGLGVLAPGRYLPISHWPAGAVDFDEVHDAPDDSFWAGERPLVDPPDDPNYLLLECPHTRKCRPDSRCDCQPRPPRVIEGRGLDVGEQDAEWTDCDGDRWRYNHTAQQWENKISRPDIATTWYPALPHERNAPYTEIIRSSSADGLAPSGGPLAEDRPAPHPAPLEGAALGPLTRDDLMDAANAAGRMATVSPAFEKHWRGLEQRLENAAIAASK